MSKRKKSDIVSKIAAITTLCLYLTTTNILDFNVNSFSYTVVLLIINLFLLPIFVLMILNTASTVFKILYCWKKHLKLKTIDLSLLLINLHPFSITLMINTNFITGNNLTYFSSTQFSQSELVSVYENYYISFSRIIYVPLGLAIIISFVFIPLKLYYVVPLIIGVCLQKIIYFSIDDDYLIYNPIISNSKEGYRINLFRFLLNYCRIENVNDKTVVYEMIGKMQFLDEKEYWQYKADLLTEMIFDSIVDQKSYIDCRDYILYLSANNIPATNGIYLNSVDVLRYFAIYNMIVNDNNDISSNIIIDIQRQLEMMKEDAMVILLNPFFERYLYELKSQKVNILMDFKYHCLYKVSEFRNKRIQVSNIYNSKMNAII